MFDHLAIRCKHREPLRRPQLHPQGKPAGHGPECGALVYVLALSAWSELVSLVPGGPATDGRPALLFTAEVTYAELEDVRRRRLDVTGVLDYLGVRFPTPAWESLPASGPTRS